MRLVRQPDIDEIRGVFTSVLAGELSREAAVTWQRGVQGQYDCETLSVDDGYWYFCSISALTVPLNLGDGEPWFVRERDIREYLADLAHEPCHRSVGEVRQCRSFEVDRDRVCWPLLMFEHTVIDHFDALGLMPVRGIFDEHHDLVEHLHLSWQDEQYLFVRQYDDQAHQLMALGSSRDTDRFRDLLQALSLTAN